MRRRVRVQRKLKREFSLKGIPAQITQIPITARIQLEIPKSPIPDGTYQPDSENEHFQEKIELGLLRES